MAEALAWLADPWPLAGAVSPGSAQRGAGSLPPGRWGRPDQLALPLSDRGLLLADGLFETLLVENGRPRLLAEHLDRWRASAALLGMAPPPPLEPLMPLLAEAVARSGISAGALRLNWTRGSAGPGSRGLDPAGPDAPPPAHRFWLQLTPWRPCFAPLAVIVSPTERRCATSLLSRCKTFAYGAAIQARRQAREAGADDALLLGSDGTLCSGTVANLLLRQGGHWLTPPLASGCLPGVMRARALASGLAQEAALSPDLLGGGAAACAALLINSLGCRPLARCQGRPLQPLSAREAEALWRSLL